MLTKEQKEQIAERHGVKVYFVYQLLAEDKFTTIPGLAIELSKFTGKKPIDYFNPRNKHVRKLALKLHPEMNKRSKKA